MNNNNNHQLQHHDQGGISIAHGMAGHSLSHPDAHHHEHNLALVDVGGDEESTAHQLAQMQQISQMQPQQDHHHPHHQNNKVMMEGSESSYLFAYRE